MAKIGITTSVISDTSTEYEVRFTLKYYPSGSGYFNNYSTGTEAARWSIEAGGGTSSGAKAFDTSPSSQTLGTRNVTFQKKSSSQTKSYSGKFVTKTGLGTLNCSGSITVPALPKRSVTFYGNGATSGSTSTKQVPHGTTFTFPTCGYVKTGYKFIGWGSSSGATTNLIKPGATSSAVGANRTYYAIWQLNTFKVTYNANGGSSAPAAQTKTAGQALTLKSTATRAGYTLKSWNTKSDGTGTSYALGASYTKDSNITLYARWTANEYSIVFNKNNQSATGTMADLMCTYDVTNTLPANSFVDSDYIFKGWSTKSSGAVVYQSEASIKNLARSGTVTLYAIWEWRYTAPNIQAITAHRVNESDIADDTGTRGKVNVYVTPAKYKEVDGTEVDIETEIIVEYRVSGAIEYLNGSSCTITESEATTHFLEGPFSQDNSYDIRVTAHAAEGVESKRTSIITRAEFVIDIDSTGRSIGIFDIAMEDIANKTVCVNGELLLKMDNADPSSGAFQTAANALSWSDVIS